MSIGFSWIDFKLAGRMLVRFPGFSIISTIGLAVGIAIAAGAFVIVSAMMNPALPLPEGDRIVSIVALDVATSRSESRLLADFTAWRRATTIEQAGVTRTVSRNLIIPGTVPEAVALAEISASGFAVARVPAVQGRYLQTGDEQPSAPPVVVIGFDEWRRRFEAAPDIIGRQIQLGDRVHTIVGVMPQGFAFPQHHSFWIPWRQDPGVFSPRTGPEVNVFARLAPAATMEQAQAEIGSIGQGLAAQYPQTHEHLRPQVVPYTSAYTEAYDPENAMALRAIQIALLLLLAAVSVNVAILVYARTANRQGEIAVRTALGASRRRIVTQLFLEALVLASAGATAGLVLLMTAFSRLDVALQQLTGSLPFWVDLRVTSTTVLYTVLLTVLAAALIGVVPALKATGAQVRERLQGLSGGSGSRLQMGRLWTGLIITQVAMTVALLPASMFHAWDSLRSRTPDRSIAGQQLLTAGLTMDRVPAAVLDPAQQAVFRAQYASRLTDLEARIEGDARVSGASFALADAGTELAMVAEAEGQPVPATPVDYNIVEGSVRGHLVRFNRIAPDFFDVYEVPLILGHTPRPGDSSIVVNRTFADRVFGGQNPIGRRVKYVGRSREAEAGQVALGEWYHVVGVVPDFPSTAAIESQRVSVVYHAVAPGESYPMTMVVRVAGGDPSAFAGRMREISAAVDPTLQLRNLTSYQELMKREEGVLRIIGVTTAAAIGSVTLLSAAGIWALLSFTVARRRKEIGIRIALGANPVRILSGVFTRVLKQLAAGVVLGVIGSAGIEQILQGDVYKGEGLVIVSLSIGVMVVVSLIAAWGPARRGLRIQPIQALRED
ncbi:MAG TPA: ABC transporter permease [Vicinamibacterales bacterium]|nr:ABC transporter permease [Vicinamibacterales bacterium]